jgi:hypothetical protein
MNRGGAEVAEGRGGTRSGCRILNRQDAKDAKFVMLRVESRGLRGKALGGEASLETRGPRGDGGVVESWGGSWSWSWSCGGGVFLLGCGG